MIFFVHALVYIVYTAYVYIYTHLAAEQKPAVSTHILGMPVCVFMCVCIFVCMHTCVCIYVCVYEKQMHCRQIKQINIDSDRSKSL